MSATTPRVEVVQDAAALAAAAAERFVRAARDAAGDFAVALAGGTTPRAMHGLLAGERRGDVAWDRVEIWFGDERCVPPDHDESNFRAVRLDLLERLDVPPRAVHRIEGERVAVEAARRYDAALHARRAPLDLVILGLGADGHMASLFPGGPELDVAGRLATSSLAPSSYATRDRVSLTLEAIGAARQVLVLVSGAAKRAAVRRSMAGDASLPLARLRHPALTLLLDRDAA